MIGESGTARSGEVKRYYKCSGKKHNNGCKKSQIRKDELEDCIVNAIILELSKPDIMDSIVAKIMSLQNEN